MDLALATVRPEARLAAMLRRPTEHSEGLRPLAEFVGPHAGPDFDEQARSLVNVLPDRIEEIRAEDELRGAVLLHALKLHPDTASLRTMKDRFRVAVERGLMERRQFETLRKYWQVGRTQLAERLEELLSDLATDPQGWGRFRKVPDNPGPDIVTNAQPIVVTRQVGTYWITERRTDRAITERWIRAVAPVAAYTVTAWSPNVPEAEPFEVRAGLNCRSGAAEIIDHHEGGRTIEVPMLFPHRLDTGEAHFFSSEVAGQRNRVPIIEVQVSGQSIDRLTLRLQFEADDQPAEIWWFAECLDDDRLRRPRPEEQRMLTCTELGYLEYRFPEQCRPREKYGIAWRWQKRPDTDGEDADVRVNTEQ